MQLKKLARKLTRDPQDTERNHRVKLSGFNPVINGREIISATIYGTLTKATHVSFTTRVRP